MRCLTSPSVSGLASAAKASSALKSRITGNWLRASTACASTLASMTAFSSLERNLNGLLASL
jgi:hypothetical protein